MSPTSQDPFIKDRGDNPAGKRDPLGIMDESVLEKIKKFLKKFIDPINS